MRGTMRKLLVVDDDRDLCLSLKDFFSNDFDVLTASDGEEAIQILKRNSVDVMLLDVRLRADQDGLEYMDRFLALEPDLSIMMISGNREFEVVQEAMRRGAVDYIYKGADPEDWKLSLDRVSQFRKLSTNRRRFVNEIKKAQNEKSLLGKSNSIQNLRETIEKVRNSRLNVVITGETGSGKEVVARQLRAEDQDGNLEPFVAVDSATIQSSMAESILFGHEKGAFTGALEKRKGAFEEANGGSIYFDEIANMPIEIQQKLLRVIQEKEIVRLGSSKVISLDFRVICATNKNLESLVKEGKFIEDLYQRLNVVPLSLPPLRERKEDFDILLAHFTKNCARSIFFTEAAIDQLKLYRWPGNIRELQNLISYLSVVSDLDEIDVCDLPPKFLDNRSLELTIVQKLPEKESSAQESFYDLVAEFEKSILKEAYSKHSGNISKLAQALKMDRSHLYTKLKLYELHGTRIKEAKQAGVA